MAKLKLSNTYSKRQLLIFAAVFAVLGGLFIYRTFAQQLPPPIPAFNMSASANPAPWNSTVYLSFSVSYPVGLSCSSNIGSPSHWIGNSQTVTLNNAQGGYQWLVSCSYSDQHRDQSYYLAVENPPPPPPPAPSLSFSASPSTINKGSSSTLSWSSSNTSSCSASGAWSGSKSTSGSQSVSPGSTSTYSLACSGAGGSTSKSTTVTVNLSFPTVSLSASPSTITKGKSSTLSWSSSNATACSAPWTSSTATSGSKSVSPSSTTTYAITCANASGNRSATRTVFVTAPGTSVPKPTVRLVANPASISYNAFTYLQWSSSYASSCSASWTKSKATVGTQQVGRLTSAKTYSITCTGQGGSTMASAKVSVGAKPVSCTTNCPKPKAPPPPKHDIEPTLDDDFGFDDDFIDEGSSTDDEKPNDGAKSSGGAKWLVVLLLLPFIALFLWWVWLKSPLITWVKVVFTIIPLSLLILLLAL